MKYFCLLILALSVPQLRCLPGSRAPLEPSADVELIDARPQPSTFFPPTFSTLIAPPPISMYTVQRGHFSVLTCQAFLEAVCDGAIGSTNADTRRIDWYDDCLKAALVLGRADHNQSWFESDSPLDAIEPCFSDEYLDQVVGFAPASACPSPCRGECVVSRTGSDLELMQREFQRNHSFRVLFVGDVTDDGIAEVVGMYTSCSIQGTDCPMVVFTVGRECADCAYTFESGLSTGLPCELFAGAIQ